MARIARTAVATLAGLIRSRDGLNARLSEIATAENVDLQAVRDDQVVAGNLFEGAGATSSAGHDPIVQVYCDKISNVQREKFLRFSGTARLVIEIRVSANRPASLEERLQLYTEALTEILEQNRGDWGQGISFGGGYEIQFQAPQAGGKNYVQTAKVVLEIRVSQPHTVGS